MDKIINILIFNIFSNKEYEIFLDFDVPSNGSFNLIDDINSFFNTDYKFGSLRDKLKTDWLYNKAIPLIEKDNLDWNIDGNNYFIPTENGKINGMCYSKYTDGSEIKIPFIDNIEVSMEDYLTNLRIKKLNIINNNAGR